LFQGEEWGTKTPFYYFVSHGDSGLMEAVSRGRLAEHEEFFAAHEGSSSGSSEAFADPAEAATFEACRLDWRERESPVNAQLLALHRALFELRRVHPSLGNCRRDLTRAVVDETR